MHKPEQVFAKDELNVSKHGVKIIPAAQANRIPLILESMEEVRSRLDDCEESMRQQGYDAGFAKGLSEGSTNLLTLLNDAERYYQANEKHILDLIMASIRQILGADFEQGELVLLMAVNALKQLRTPNSVTLTVHPDVIKTVEDRISTYTDNAIIIRVVADETMIVTDCKLDTQFGSIDAGLNTQLKAIENMLYVNSHDRS